MKKVTFKSLKPGTKFRYRRKLYIKDEHGFAVQLSNGSINISFDEMLDELVTPVKLNMIAK